MIPKGKLLALLLVFTAVGGLAATGAFTTVEAERTATVNVDGDADALLAIEPKNTDTNDFVNQGEGTGDSELQIDLSGGDANSLNTNAATNEENIITITNNGENTVSFFIATEGGLQDGSVGFDGSTDPQESDDANVADSVNVEFYVDDGNVVSSSEAPPASGEVIVNDSTDYNDSPVPLADEVTSDLDTFVDGSSGASGASADYSISHQGDRQTTPGSDASAVQLGPGESVDVSIYVEIDVDGEDFSDLSDVSVLDQIVIIGVDSGTVTGDLKDTSSDDTNA
jgi:hypothetical protein